MNIDQAISTMHKQIEQDKKTLIRTVFREKGYDTDEKIIAVAHRVQRIVFNDGSERYELDGETILMLGRIVIDDNIEGAKLMLRYTRTVAFQ